MLAFLHSVSFVIPASDERKAQQKHEEKNVPQEHKGQRNPLILFVESSAACPW